MSEFIRGTIPGPIPCACGKHTHARCHFEDGGTHGVCIDCGSVKLVKFPDGKMSSRLICLRCQVQHRHEIWESALLDLLRGR